jgi:hypothetical protein
MADSISDSIYADLCAAQLRLADAIAAIGRASARTADSDDPQVSIGSGTSLALTYDLASQARGQIITLMGVMVDRGEV